MPKPLTKVSEGDVYGCYTVISEAPKQMSGTQLKRAVKVRCACGREYTLILATIRAHSYKGCKVCSRQTHKLSNTRLYSIYRNMNSRCYRPDSVDYEYYGGRGITICDEWRDDFVAFYNWANANGYDDTLEIDRKNNDGNYTPENCRFVTRAVNCDNKRNKHVIEFDGKSHTIKEWSDITGIKVKTIKSRLRYGWSPQKTLTKQVKNK